eukprot:Sspe_Gene.97972::Locus_71456_Transcript_1_1_Confidence_1.000_Length_1117::g.97972::m.97972
MAGADSVIIIANACRELAKAQDPERLAKDAVAALRIPSNSVGAPLAEALKAVALEAGKMQLPPSPSPHHPNQDAKRALPARVLQKGRGRPPVRRVERKVPLTAVREDAQVARTSTGSAKRRCREELEERMAGIALAHSMKKKRKRQTHTENSTKVPFKVGDAVVARWGEDGCYYVAKLLRISEDKGLVSWMDTGSGQGEDRIPLGDIAPVGKRTEHGLNMCAVCHHGDFERVMMECDSQHCPVFQHLFCCSPMLDRIPDTWKCDFCTSRRPTAGQLPINHTYTVSTLLHRLKNGTGHLVALVGAGISTAAGIPDFRGLGGLYSAVGAEAFSKERFSRDPSALYRALSQLFCNST